MSEVQDIHVLVFVHDEHFRKKVKSFLSLENIYVHDCKTEEEVIQLIDSDEKIDVAVIDILPNENSGLRCLEYVKSSREQTEVIMLNSHDQIALSIQVMRLGAFDDILFPFEMKSLKEKILMAYDYGKIRQGQIGI